MDRPAVNTEPCPGHCHSGDFRDFDHYCDVNNLTVEDTPVAFAAFLNHETGWDGTMTEVTGEVSNDHN